MSNPVLAEVTRGTLVESRHRGAVAVCAGDGAILLAVGDVTSAIFPRSALKPLQALPLIETGTADALHLSPAEIAICCGSHSGSDRHVKIVEQLLARTRLEGTALGCGAHAPLDSFSAQALLGSALRPQAIHNNCSGKHAGMLATAVCRGEDVAGYWKPGHPVQQRIERVICEMTGLSFGPEHRGIDGCSVPCWAMPLTALARAYARLGSGTGLDAKRQAACGRLLAACLAEPDMVAGPNERCTHLIKATSQTALLKAGAEGVYCATIAHLGLGIAIKIDDGAGRACEVVAGTVLSALMPECREALTPLTRSTLLNWRGLEVGAVRPSPLLMQALRNGVVI